MSSCARSACTPPILARFCGVCVGVRVLSSRRQSWLGFMVGVSGFVCRFHPGNPGWVLPLCVFVCVLRLYPANPGWRVRCVCPGLGFAFTPAFVAGVLAWMC